MSRWVTHPYLCPPDCSLCRDDDARAVAQEGMEPDRAEERIEDDRERWVS